MADTTTVLIDRHDDPYAWLMEQAGAVRDRHGIDYAGLLDFIEEAACEIMSKATSQMVNLMAHATKVACTGNPEIRGHWLEEIAEFQDQIIDAYRPSMRQKIDLERLWRRAVKLVAASFRQHGETLPELPAECPFTLDLLTSPDADPDEFVARAMAAISSRNKD